MLFIIEHEKIVEVKEQLNQERIKNKKIIEKLSKEIDEEEERNENLNSKIEEIKTELEEEKTANENLTKNIQQLENEIEELKNENQKLTIKNNRLSYELKEEKENNYSLMKKLNKYKKILDDGKFNEKEINDKLKEMEKASKKNLDKITQLYTELDEKDKKIDKLRIKLSRFPFELLTGERMMTIILNSNDFRILYSVICKNTDNFSKIEDEFYEQFPQFRKYENIFWLKDRKINRHKSLESNKIQNNDMINIEIR